MKNITLFLICMIAIAAIGCSGVLENKLNGKDFEKVKSKIEKDEKYSSMKKKYIIDELSGMISFASAAKETFGVDSKNIPTFSQQVDLLSKSYDSIFTAKKEAIKNNKKLERFITLENAKVIPISEYDGYLFMDMNFNNEFEKEILYCIVEYSAVNKYDTEYFKEKTKITDEVAEDFKGIKQLSINEKYNDVAKFMHSKVPVQANLNLRKQLGEKVANEKVMKDFLMETLKIKTLLVVFKDKTSVSYEDATWDYFEL